METTQTPTSATTGPNSDDTNRARRPHWLWCLALGTMMSVAATPVAGVRAERSNSTDLADSLYVACLRSSAGTPDALERYVDVCVDRAATAQRVFETCVQSAARTPDALEHWIEPCAARALSNRVSTS